VLDRNGLRPSRYTITHDGLAVLASEAGVLEIEPQATDPLEVDETGEMSERIGQRRIEPLAQLDTEPVAIRLTIGAQQWAVELPLDNVIYLGRRDPTLAYFPEVDLTDEGEVASSVSRRHARILKREKAVLVEDLDSSNGTFINGKRLSAYLSEILSDGDTLQLGRLPIGVMIRRQSRS